MPQVSLLLHMDWVEPAFSFSREDVEPAKRVLDFSVGWFAEPIFGSGDYPLGMRSWLRQLNSLEYRHFGGILKIGWNECFNGCFLGFFLYYQRDFRTHFSHLSKASSLNIAAISVLFSSSVTPQPASV